MTGFELYVFLLSLLIFVLFSALFTTLAVLLCRYSIRLIRCGEQDERITAEYRKLKNKKKQGCSCAGSIVSGIICLLLLAALIFSLYVNLSSNTPPEGFFKLQVVSSSSMSFKNKNNDYLFENDLNDQFQTFDLVLTRTLPAEEELKLWDVVVYERDGMAIIHRIVGIEEPNEKHGERWFLLQGDASSYQDDFPVTYEQMKSIYLGERIPCVGSFIMFLQSPAGFFCIALIMAYLIAVPIAERKLKLAVNTRLIKIGVMDEHFRPLSSESKPDVAASFLLEGATPQSAPTTTEQTPSTATEQARKERNAFLESIGKSKLPLKEQLEKLEKETIAYDTMLKRYYEMRDFLLSLPGVKARDSKRYETFKVGRIPVAKLTFKKKTPILFLALTPQDMETSKCPYTLVGQKKKSELYPIKIKLGSDRKIKYSKELLVYLMQKNGLK